MTATGELRAAGITDPALISGYRLCRSLNSHHGKTYFLATLLLPPAKRPHVHALYGFARYADDKVDEHVDASTGSTVSFEAFATEFLTDLDRGTAEHPVLAAVLDTIQRWQIPRSYFADFLDSMRMDLTVTEYATYDDLAKYMWGSAAVIGLQMLPILGRVSEEIPWSRLEPHAVDLGLAFQLTNFIRDVAEDLRRGRIYLPQDSLAQFGVTAERLRLASEKGLASAEGGVDEPIRNLLAYEIERARGLYRSAHAGVALVHPASQDCLRTALTLYGEILDEIERRDYDVFHGRVSVGLRRRATVGLSAYRAARRLRRGVPTARA